MAGELGGVRSGPRDAPMSSMDYAVGGSTYNDPYGPKPKVPPTPTLPPMPPWLTPPTAPGTSGLNLNDPRLQDPKFLAKNPQLKKQLGGGGGGGGGGGTGGPGPRGPYDPVPPTGGSGGVTNTTQISPWLQQQLDRYNERFDVDNTQRAIDRSTLGTMDAAALAARDSGAANAAQRGVSGTGVSDAYNARHFFEPAQRQAAGNAAEISMDREKALDALVLGGTGLARAPDEIGLSNRDLALRQQLGEEDIGLRKGQLDLQAEQLAKQQQNDAWSQYLALLNLYQ